MSGDYDIKSYLKGIILGACLVSLYRGVDAAIFPIFILLLLLLDLAIWIFKSSQEIKAAENEVFICIKCDITFSEGGKCSCGGDRVKQ